MSGFSKVKMSAFRIRTFAIIEADGLICWCLCRICITSVITTESGVLRKCLRVSYKSSQTLVFFLSKFFKHNARKSSSENSYSSSTFLPFQLKNITKSLFRLAWQVKSLTKEVHDQSMHFI